MSLKCTNWRVKCILCASDAVLALERRFTRPELALASAHAHKRARPNSHARTHVRASVYTKSRPQNESGLKLPCAMPAVLCLQALQLRFAPCLRLLPASINLAAA